MQKRLFLKLRDDALMAGALRILVEEMMELRRGCQQASGQPQDEHHGRGEFAADARMSGSR